MLIANPGGLLLPSSSNDSEAKPKDKERNLYTQEKRDIFNPTLSMKEFRPRLSENEFNYFQNKRLTDKKSYTVLLKSDEHGWLSDLGVQRCINKVIQNNHFDEIALGGDLGDWPLISRHEKRVFGDPFLDGYSEVEEARYIREHILAPLRYSAGETKITFIPGNHDERITKPHLLTIGQQSRLAVLFKERQHTEYQNILDFDKNGIEWDGKTEKLDWFDKFTFVHGLSLAKNAPESNIKEYMGSGASGHTHRLQAKYITNKRAPYVWLEVGCGRLRDKVEYLPTNKIADWQHGFATVTFYKDGNKTSFFAETHVIVENRCKYNGVIYDGNPSL